MGDELCSVSARRSALHSGQRLQFSSHRTTQSFLSCSQSFMCLFVNTRHAVMCLFLRSGFHLAIKPRFVKCCRDCGPSGRFSHLTKELCGSVRVVIGFLFISLIKVLLCPVAQFGRTARSRKSLGSSIFFPFPNDEAHCALGNFQHSLNFCIPFSWFMPSHNSISEFYRLGLHGRVSAVGPHLERCVSFSIMSN